MAIVIGRVGRVMVFGSGTCPEGPGRFMALDLGVRPPRILRLVDNGD